jgi:ABC-type nitrate/sulfonate/bicarbonate transport system substrate-binding protein
VEEAFAEKGAEVVLLQSLPEQEHIKHLTQEAPLAFRDGGNVPPIWSHSKGTPTLVIGLNGIIQSHAIIVAPDSEIRTVQDLRGKRLSVPDHGGKVIDPMRAMTLRGYDTILKGAGIDPSEVVFVDTPVDGRANSAHVDAKGNLIGNREGVSDKDFVSHHVEEIKALREGRIDAFFSHRALVSQIVHKGIGRVLIDIAQTDLPQVNNIYPTVITVDAGFAKANRDIVVEYLYRLLLMAKTAAADPENYEVLTVKAQFGVTVEEQKETREKTWYTKLAPSFDEELVAALAEQKRFLLEKGIIEQDFDLSEWIDESFLEEAKERFRQLNKA